MTGFTESATVAALSELAPPLVVDLGSGLLDAACPWLAGGPPAWLRSEPAVRQTLEAGAALAIFSGDKLLGGPQAGIVAGRADLIQRCAAHPLYRAVRPGGLVLRALQDVALAYLRREGDALPFWRMATAPVDGLRHRAAALIGGDWAAVDTRSLTGGGTLPGVEIPSAGLACAGDLTAGLRSWDPPVIARVEDDRTILDLRTVDPADDPTLGKALRRLGRSPA
jgi:L-seryl-tRNA(Ser) seleniumtransferase